MKHEIIIDKVNVKTASAEYLLSVNGHWEVMEMDTTTGREWKILRSSIPTDARIMPYILAAIIEAR